MGFQFIHMESYSRKADAKGRSVDFVFGEGSRRPDCSVHVSNPASPVLVHGISLDQVREMHDAAIESTKVEVAGGKQRKIRTDQKTLHTVVASHPATMGEIRTDPVARQAAEAWEKRTIDWLKKMYGDDLKCVVRHEDESHYHLHAYILPLSDPALKARQYHPGYVAKRAVIDAGGLDTEDKKALSKRADAAYKAAMRQWQDNYHDAVALPCGLTRLGPQRRRLTRDEWQREQAQAKALQKTVERATVVKEQGQRLIEKTKSEAAKITNAATEKMNAAQRATAAAARERQQAQLEKEEAAAIIAHAERYSGLSGKVRAAWDRLKESELIARIREEFRKEIDHWKGRALEAEGKRLEAERKLHEVERHERAARAEAMKAGIERDQLKALLPKSENSKPLDRLDELPKLELKPNFLKKKEYEKEDR